MSKKILFVFATMSIAATFLLLAGCSNNEEKQRQEEAMSVVASGLVARWDTTQVSTSTFEDQVEVLKDGIMAEYDVATSVDTSAFEDEEFKATYERYLVSLESQLDGIASYTTDVDLYNTKYIDEGTTIEKACLNTFKTNYGLEFGENEKRFEQEQAKVDYRHISTGQMVSLSSANGDIELSIEKVVNDSQDTVYAQDSSLVTDSQYYGLLVCKVKNVSFSDQFNPELFILYPFVNLITPDGVTQTPLSSAYANTSFNEGAGAVWDKEKFPVGQTVQCAIPYALDNGVESVIVRLCSNEEVIVPVEQM